MALRMLILTEEVPVNFKNTITVTVGVILALFAGGMLAQDAPKSAPQSTQQMKAKMQEKMKGGGMGMMGQMMAGHDEISKLVTQLKESAAAMRAEKDPAALQTKLAQHAALIDQLQAKMSAQHSMMQGMMQGATPPESGKASK